jgi:hypothetical protein
VLFVFGNEAYLRCIKNEAGKRACGSRRRNIALRFTAQRRRFIEAVRLLLHIAAGAASLKFSPAFLLSGKKFG